MMGLELSWLSLATAMLMLPQPQYVQRWRIAQRDAPQPLATKLSLAEKSPIVRLLKQTASTLGGQHTSPGQHLANAAAMDLLSASIRMGLPVSAALRAVAPIAGAVAPQLMLVARSVELGADTITSWSPVAATAGWSGVGRLAGRSAQSGASLAQGIADIATQQRTAAGDAAEAAAERAGVLIAGPLALCFLPAFVVLGLVPAVIGLAGAMELSW